MEKMEQIGKAVLDYRFYPEDDKYTDGAIEVRCWRSPEIVHLSNMNV